MMRKEMEAKDQDRHLDFKNLLFATGPVSRDPDIFYRLFPEDFGLSEDDEAELEWEIPTTVGEAEKLLGELRAHRRPLSN